MIKLKSYLKKIFLFTISIFISLLVVEFYLRKTSQFPSITGATHLGSNSIILSNNSIVEDVRFNEEQIYTNVKNKDLIIVSMGDSFTEGHPVEFKHQYTEILRQKIEGQSVGVINMGLGDSGPDQQLKIFEKHILSRMDPDIVIWQFYPNDIWDSLSYPLYTLNNSGELVSLEGSKTWFYKMLNLYSHLSFLGKIRSESYVVRHLLSSIENLYKYEEVPANISDINAWSLSKISKEIEYMEKLSQEKDFEIYYVLIAPQLIYDSNPANFPDSSWAIVEYQKLRNLLSQRNFIDAYFSKELLGELAITDVFVGGDRDLAPYGERHYNEAGYSILADLIFDKINNSIVSN